MKVFNPQAGDSHLRHESSKVKVNWGSPGFGFFWMDISATAEFCCL